jgi:hypothetical protein
MQSNDRLNMMRPCCLNPLLSVHKALEGTFLFDTMLMALLGTEVLVHQKPRQRKTWGFHATKVWYLSHVATHYPCICIIMKDTGGERVTETFQYQHHAIPVLAIMANNCILEATCHLADAINGIQEAPPEKMAAIQSLQGLLLGKETPQEPEPSPQPCRPKAPLAVLPLAETEHNDPPIRMWNPRADMTPTIHILYPTARLPTSSAPAMIQDNIDKFDTPPIPVIANSPARSHCVQPPQAQPITRSQLRERMTHMINSKVSDALMSRPVKATANTPLAIGYTFTEHQMVLCKLATNHFLGAIIDEDTCPVLEYRHLVKNLATKSVWEISFANKIGCLYQGIQDLKSTTTCFFIQKLQVPTNKWPTYGRIVCNFCPQKKE